MSSSATVYRGDFKKSKQLNEDWEQGGGSVREQNRAGPAIAAAGCVYGGRLEFPRPHLLPFQGGGEEVGGFHTPKPYRGRV